MKAPGRPRGKRPRAADVERGVRSGSALWVASVAAQGSCVHQRACALQGGADATSATLWPLSVDGLLLPATVGLLKPTCHVSGRTRRSAWMVFYLGIGVASAADTSGGAPAAGTDRPAEELSAAGEVTAYQQLDLLHTVGHGAVVGRRADLREAGFPARQQGLASALFGHLRAAGASAWRGAGRRRAGRRRRWPCLVPVGKGGAPSACAASPRRSRACPSGAAAESRGRCLFGARTRRPAAPPPPVSCCVSDQS